MFVAKENKGIHVSDECYKMAITDAISVACKQLGVGADVYWEKDRTKYDSDQNKSELTQVQIDELHAELKRTGCGRNSLLKNYQVNSEAELSLKQFEEAMEKLKAKPDKETAQKQQAEQTAKAVDAMDDSGLPWK